MNRPQITAGLKMLMPLVCQQPPHRGKKRKRCERCGADGKALADCGRCIAHRIELIRNAAHAPIKLRHLSNAARVIRDRAVSIHRYGDAGCGQHTHRSEGNTIQAGEFISNQNPHRDNQHWNCRGFHADRKAADNRRRRAGLRLFGNLLDEAVIAGGEHFRDLPDNQADHKPANTALKGLESWKKYWLITPAPNQHQKGGDIGAHLERLVRVAAILAAHAEGGNNRSDDTRCRRGRWGTTRLPKTLLLP